MMDINDLAAEWLEAKETERKAIETRRELEDKMLSLIGIAEDFEGTVNAGEAYKIKVTARLTRKIDADLIQEIAAEHGLEQWLGTVCRWKPEVDAKAWKQAPDNVTNALEKAITTTASRPSFSITKE